MQNLHEFLTKNGLTISCAESLTGGRIQSLLSSLSGSSSYFVGGITCYTINQKVTHLGVDRTIAEQCDCVSEYTVQEMVQGSKHLFGSDIALATTGYAESSPEHNVFKPYAWIAMIDQDNTILTRQVFAPTKQITRNQMQHLVAEEAINIYTHHVLSTTSP